MNEALRAQLVQGMLRQVGGAKLGLVLLKGDKRYDQFYGILYAHGDGVLAAVRPVPTRLCARLMYNKIAKVPSILAKMRGSFDELASLVPSCAPVLVIESQPEALQHLSRLKLWKLMLEAIRKQVESSGATPESPFYLLMSGLRSFLTRILRRKHRQSSR